MLDFADNQAAVELAFQEYYRATIQSGETDPNKLHDLKRKLDESQVYAWEQVEQFVGLYLADTDLDKLDPILDTCVEEYKKLDEKGQVEFKGKAKTFNRSYGFLAAVLTYGRPEWEKLSIFLDLLLPKLPAPQYDDVDEDVLKAIDLDSYRTEKLSALKLAMKDEDAVVELPDQSGSGGLGGDSDNDEKLSTIVKQFNHLFGNIDWKDADKIKKVVAEDLPQMVAQDKATRTPSPIPTRPMQSLSTTRRCPTQ